MKKISLGDYFAIKLSENFVIGQFVGYRKTRNEIVRIFDYFIDNIDDFKKEEINPKKILFPPVCTALQFAINSRKFKWKILSNGEIESDFNPNFLLVMPGLKEFTAKSIVVVENDIVIDIKDPKYLNKYKDFESDVIWPPIQLVNRIETGENPFKKMIEDYINN